MAEQTEERNVYVPPPTNDVVRLADWMQARWARHLLDEATSDSSGVGPVANNWLSEGGHPCIRHSYYHRTGADRAPFEPILMSVFRFGDVVERETVADIREKLGLDWIKSQMSAFDRELRLSGRIDGGIKRREEREATVIGEIKGVQGQAFAAIKPGLAGLYDVYKHRQWWIRKFLYQIGGYVCLSPGTNGMLILRSKSTWDIRFIPVPRQHEITQSVWRDLQDRTSEVNAAVEANEAPDRIKYTKDVCSRCEYADTVCHPDRPAEGVEILTHPALIESLEEMDALEEQSKVYDERKSWVKAQIRAAAEASGRDVVIIGGRWEAKVAKNKAVRIKTLPENTGGLIFGEEDDE